MKRAEGAAALAMALCLCLSLPSCGEKRVTGYLRTDYDYGSRETVAAVGEYEVPKDLYAYFLRSHEDDLSEADSSGGKTASDLARDSLREYFAVIDLAREYDLALTKDEVTAVEEALESARGDFSSEDAYRAAMSGSHLTEETYYNILAWETLREKLYDYMTEESNGVIDSTDATVEEDIAQNFYSAVQIFIEVSEGEGDDRTERRAAAENLLARSQDLDDAAFERLALEEGDDAYGARIFTRGETHEFFEEAVSKLKVGQTSGIIESEMGYHIIRRLPLDAQKIDENFDSLREKYLARKYNEAVRARGEQMSWEEK